jgi:hypothetical protein
MTTYHAPANEISRTDIPFSKAQFEKLSEFRKIILDKEGIFVYF